MVCIIDDREDVWNFAPNLVHVKPYIFFKNVGDINAPEKLQKSSKQNSKTPQNKELKKGDSPSDVPTNLNLDCGEEQNVTDATDLSMSTNPPTENYDSKNERRDSIDMPTIEETLRKENRIKEREMEGTASVVSDDLELSDDNGSNSGTSSGTSSTESTKKGNDQKCTENITPLQRSGVPGPISNVSQETCSSNMDTENETTNNKCGNNQVEETKVSSDVNAKQHGKTEDDPSEGVNPVSTEDSDSSAKSGKENDDDEFKLKKDGDVNDKDNTLIEDDLFLDEDTDDYLLYLEDTLKSIHQAYYNAYDRIKTSGKIPDLKEIIPSVKRQSLKGTSIVFSGVIPTHIQLERSKPFLVARSLGAEVTNKITRQTTHLVAARTGTAKVNEAKKRAKNVHLVTPDWLWCCAERWERIDERLYPLYKAAPITVKPPAHCSSPEDNAADRLADLDPSTLDFTGRLKTTERQLSSESLPESINPFCTLSTEDFKEMDKEVEDILSNESSMSSSSDEDQNTEIGMGSEGRVTLKKRKAAEPEYVQLSDSSNSDDESLTGEYPRGMKRKHRAKDNGSDGDDENEFGGTEGARDGDALERFQQGGMIPDDFEIEAASDDDDGEEDREMAEQLEREFMEGEDSLSNSNF